MTALPTDQAEQTTPQGDASQGGRRFVPLPVDARTIIEPQDVEWEMNWGQRREDGSRMHPDKPEREMMFEHEPALALLLINEKVFLNSHWWRKDWPELARNLASLNVNCNDVFAWGCADAEEMTHDQIEDVYRYWSKDPSWGTEVWCIIQRRELPQRPVAESMRAGGIWDLDALALEHGLRPNYYDGVGHIRTGQKYAAYSAWATSAGLAVLPWDKHWWSGWKSYAAANPEWNTPEWQAEGARLVEEFKTASGYTPYPPPATVQVSGNDIVQDGPARPATDVEATAGDLSNQVAHHD